jgi:hypothetical protein
MTGMTVVIVEPFDEKYRAGWTGVVWDLLESILDIFRI